jgi:hypothetical protein
VGVPDLAGPVRRCSQRIEEAFESANPGRPRLRGLGAVSAVILAPERGCAVGVAVFEDEAAARKAASTVRVGGQAGPNPVIRFRTVEVRESWHACELRARQIHRAGHLGHRRR